MAAIGVDVGDMFLMDLSDTMDDSSSSAFSSASSSASQQSQEVKSCKPTALSILNSSAKQNIHQQQKYSNQTLLSNDTQLLQSSSQIQQRQFQNINHQVTNDHNNYKTNISINNYHRRDFNNSADIYRQSSMQHKARESLFWTPIGPNPIDADVNDYDEDDDHDDDVRANYHNGNKRYSAGQQNGVSSVGDLLASSDSYMLRPFSGIGRGSPSPASSIASSSASSMSPIAVSRVLSASASTSSSVSSTGLMYQLNSGLHDNGDDVDGYEKDSSRQIPSAYFNINNKQNQAHNESNVGRSSYVHTDKDEDDENNIRNSNRHGNSQIFVGEYCDEDSLSEDEYSAIRNNPSEILKSIEAIARSVHDDNQLFGSLPRRQFNTGELVLSLRLAWYKNKHTYDDIIIMWT